MGSVFVHVKLAEPESIPSRVFQGYVGYEAFDEGDVEFKSVDINLVVFHVFIKYLVILDSLLWSNGIVVPGVTCSVRLADQNAFESAALTLLVLRFE